MMVLESVSKVALRVAFNDEQLNMYINLINDEVIDVVCR